MTLAIHLNTRFSMDKYAELAMTPGIAQDTAAAINLAFGLSDEAGDIEFLDRFTASVAKAKKNASAAAISNAHMAKAFRGDAQRYKENAADFTARACMRDDLAKLYDHAGDGNLAHIGLMHLMGVLSEKAFEALCGVNVLAIDNLGNLLRAPIEPLCKANFSTQPESVQRELAELFIAFNRPNYSLLLSPAMVERQHNYELPAFRRAANEILIANKAKGKISAEQYKSIVTGQPLNETDYDSMTTVLSRSGLASQTIKHFLRKDS